MLDPPEVITHSCRIEPEDQEDPQHCLDDYYRTFERRCSPESEQTEYVQNGSNQDEPASPVATIPEEEQDQDSSENKSS